jgi:hypothetical protein
MKNIAKKLRYSLEVVSEHDVFFRYHLNLDEDSSGGEIMKMNTP